MSRLVAVHEFGHAALIVRHSKIEHVDRIMIVSRDGYFETVCNEFPMDDRSRLEINIAGAVAERLLAANCDADRTRLWFSIVGAEFGLNTPTAQFDIVERSSILHTQAELGEAVETVITHLAPIIERVTPHIDGLAARMDALSVGQCIGLKRTSCDAAQSRQN